MTAAAAAGFSSFDAALRLHDPWDTTLYNGVCFEGRKWHLLVDESSLDELPHTGRRSTPRYKAKAFQRFPILLRKVTGKAAALSAAKASACWRPGLSFVADLRHAGGPTMGIAHFAKRILRLYGLQQYYTGLHVERLVFPATSAAHLAHDWPASMLKLVGHDAATRGAAHLVDAASLLQRREAPCCFEHLAVASRENTYFTRREDADSLRAAAYALAGVPAAAPTCARPVACYFQRAEGAPNGKWEGGPRTVVNAAAVQAAMRAAMPRGEVRVVSANSSHSFVEQARHPWPSVALHRPLPCRPRCDALCNACTLHVALVRRAGGSPHPHPHPHPNPNPNPNPNQVRLFASCDLLVSVHGSHNANVMWMRAGAAFMEVNPRKFYYASYNELATVAGVALPLPLPPHPDPNAKPNPDPDPAPTSNPDPSPHPNPHPSPQPSPQPSLQPSPQPSPQP